MNAFAHVQADPQIEWLLHVGSVGLVIGPNIIREETLYPPPQRELETRAVKDLLGDEKDWHDDEPALIDPWGFFNEILDWDAAHVAGAPGGPPLPDSLAVRVPEHDVTLAPDWAVRELGGRGGFQLLVKLLPDLDADQRAALPGWEATPHAQFERLLRENRDADGRNASIGVLVDRREIRIIYAPRGETSGWLSFPVRSLGTVAGRAMLGGLKLMLGHARLFTEAEERRLPRLLARSREAQNEVSTALSRQVLGAAHELLRAMHAGDPERIERLARDRSEHLYEGLLTTLLRLVFLLFAEDRDLIPASREPASIELYEQNYSVRGLYAKLAEDRALHADTMDERVGGWGRLLALFRMVHGGLGDWIVARGGKLFDPTTFPFLEGRDDSEALGAARVLPVRDGAILNILEGLMTLEGPSLAGERVRERISYRSLDVEQIGSVYETVMGFKVEPAPEPVLAVKGEKDLPVFVAPGALVKAKEAERQKLLKEQGVAPSGKRLEAIKKAATLNELTMALAAIRDRRGSPDGGLTAAGAPVLQPTDERRRSGSHYTPRALTEPIVRHALEPAFERIGEAATPDQVLDIKVCDPACGSGAFLVEACRQLGERLEKAWGHHPALKPAIPADEDEALHARRLVAQRALYGVDKNPMAVDLAKLSLWLATLAARHEFTFLDHAVKCGDSLVGLSRAQIEAAHWDLSKPPLPLLKGLVRGKINEAATGRRDIQFAPDDTARAIQEARHRTVERRLDEPRMYGDAIVAAFFAANKPRARELRRQEVEGLLSGMSGNANEEKIAAVATTLRHGEHPIRPFHWELEFPEVFSRDNPGFDAIVGNPPFAGKNTTVAANRDGFLDWFKVMHEGAHGNADLVAHFFRRAFVLLRSGGCFGLIATNTIGQGDTRATGLAAILGMGGRITHAKKREPWPGEAAVIVSVVHVAKEGRRFVLTPTVASARNGGETLPILDGRRTSRVSAYLVEGAMDGSPERLAANARKAFQGSILLGMGFTFDDVAAAKGTSEPIARMHELLARDERNAERIKPYLGGEEVNNSPTHAHHRFAIDFEDFPLRRDPAAMYPWRQLTEETQRAKLRLGIVSADYPDPVAADWPDLLEVVERLVLPERANNPDRSRREIWWRYTRRTPGLLRATDGMQRVLSTNCGAAPHMAFTQLTSGMNYANTLAIFAFPNLAPFAALQSRVHEIWARFFSSTLEDRLRYAPSDCFETFPFPENFEIDSALEAAGQAYYDHRATLMIARNEGMTKTYNRFHDARDNAPDLTALRDLHADMDRVVLRAYGWDDLADRAAPAFLTPDTEDDHTYQGRLFWPNAFRDEVLARLLELNAERHAEEVRLGLHATRSPTRREDDEDGGDE
ncbi:N-6 DNA methylase [Mesorhizobium sp. RP14(2022)]|uniref:site-specific DNA-methyltransferase (adenine-specific) n=1 Tax=Mesorhizobium liriopis TaxID=2953882 RepID=A0ABT1C0L5_9HYPH|nr:DNA methyltransferase [Mesorhizobium liriopis]MCO6048377.1 N-6 DNA methylase [Mesorhizobium liriopis]